MTPAVLQEWEGYVSAVGELSFTARLVDLTAGDTVEGEEAEIPFSAISADDLGMVREGAFLGWKITGEGNDTKSEISFRRETWTAEDLAEAARRGAELAEGLRWS